MADNLIFPIGFDLEAGVKAAEKNADAFLRRLQETINSQPLAVKINTDGFAELGRGMDNLVASISRLNSLLTNKSDESTAAEQRLTQAITEQGNAVANTTNTMSRQLMGQEKINKALRDTYTEQERVNKLISQYHDTYDGQVESLARLNAQLAANKKAQSDNAKALEQGRITAEKYAATNVQLLAQHRQLSVEKRALNQIMTAEEKALLAQEGSYKQLSQQLSLLKTAYKELGDEGRTSPFGQELEETIQNLDAHLKDMAADIGEFQRNVGNYAIAGQNGVVSTQSLTAAIGQEARTMQDLIDQTKILEEAKRMLNKDDTNYQSTLAALNSKLDENKRKISDVSDILGKGAKSVAEAEAQNKRLSEAIKYIDLTSADAKEQLEAMRAQIARNNQTISAAIGSNEKYADSVLGLVGINGSFGSSLQSLGEGGNFFDGLKTKAQAFGKTLIGLLANPAVLAFLGIAGVAAGLKWWYSYNKGLVEASKLTQDLTGLTGDSMKAIRNEVQAVADTYNKDFRDVLNGANALAKQFGIPIQEAMQLVKDGFVAGADANGEFLKNIKEYPAYFKEAGISASEFIAITTQATNAGVYSDKGIDAIKDGNIRLREMTAATAKALDGIGISSKKVQKELADGSKTTFDIMKQVSAKLAELPKSSAKVGAALADIFGGPGEDAGLQYILTLKDIDTNLDNVKGRTGDLGQLQEAQLQSQIELENAIASVFDATGGSFESLTTHAKIFINNGIVKIIQGCVDIVNWFIRMYNKSLVVRGAVNSIVNSFKTLWEIGKFVINQVVDSFAALGTVIEGVVTLDWEKVKQGYSDGMKALGGNLETLVSNIAANTADTFNKTLKDEMKEISVGLDSDSVRPETTKGVGAVTNPKNPIDSKAKEAAKTYLQTLNRIEQAITAINAKYNDLAKKEGSAKALEHINRLYKTQLAYINAIGRQFGLSFTMPTSFETLKEYRTAILQVINKLKASGVEGAADAAINLEMKLGLGDVDKLAKDVEDNIKQLADKVSRTKTAREFYDKILGLSGDQDMAANITMSLYGDTGKDLFKKTSEYLKEQFGDVDISEAIDFTNERINYQKLSEIFEKYRDEIVEINRDSLDKQIQDGKKYSAQQVAKWFEELSKAKDIEQQRTDLIKTETEKRAAIMKSNLPQEEKDKFITLSYQAQAQGLSDLNLEEFKASEDYVKIFQDLDRVADDTLDRLEEKLRKVIAANKDLSPEKMKEYAQALDKIKLQKEQRDPLKGMVDAANEYVAARKAQAQAEVEYAKAQADYKANELTYYERIASAKAEETHLQAQLNALKEQGKGDSNEAVALELKLNEAKTKTLSAERAKEKALENVAKKQKAVTDNQDKARDASEKFKDSMGKAADACSKAADAIQNVADLLGIAEDSTLGQVINGAVSGLKTMSSVLTAILAISIAISASMWWLTAIGAGVGILSNIGNIFSAGKVKRANKEIKKQQEILDQLEYSYSRLEKTAEKLFGVDYVSNYNQRLKNLRAQAEAERKKAEAERSKGKKKDEEKIKEHENAYRDTMNEIAEMQGQVAERMLGTDLTSAARDFAKAWLDAYKEFGNTADKMSEKFREMIENMVVESLLAKVMEQALKPAFDMIDNMGEQDFYSEAFWKNVVETAEQGAKDADYGAQTVMRFLEQAGLSMRDMGTEFTGIKRDIAGASEESINGLAAALNTQNYYISHVPRIAENVAAMRALMDGGSATSVLAATTGWTDWQQQAMDNYVAIQRNTAETVVECRKIAQQCTDMAADIHRVVVPRGSKAAYGVQVYM